MPSEPISATNPPVARASQFADLRRVESAILSSFERFAYQPANPPILERASIFLDRSGEEIRRRLYAFFDPGGQELCLRPELTIPACRQLLERKPDTASENNEARISYSGPAFRYGESQQGGGEFHQAGVELIGAALDEAADAEVLAVALDALKRAGVAAPRVVIGDVGVVHAFIDGLPIGAYAKAKLKRIAWNGAALERAKDRIRLSGGNGRKKDGVADARTLASLRALGRDQAPGVIREVLSLVDVHHVGERTAEEIAERLFDRSDEAAELLSVETVEAVERLREINGPVSPALDAIRNFAKESGVSSMEEAFERAERRFALIEAYGHAPGDFLFDANLRPDLAYYTGFIFEIFSPLASGLGPLCGGGRYDSLLEALGAPKPTPAVGCAIGLERLLAALEYEETPAQRNAAPARVLVVAEDGAPYEALIKVSALMRDRGWQVETNASEGRGESAFVRAVQRGFGFGIVAGADALKSGKVRFKGLADGREREIAISALPSPGEIEQRPSPPVKPRGKDKNVA